MIVAISWNDIGTDEDLGRELLVIARGIAPCLSSISVETEEGKDARAILRRVYKHVTGRGARYIKTQRIATASVEYTDLESAFDGDPRRGLQALCSSSAARAHSVGSFPAERPVAGLWPETY